MEKTERVTRREWKSPKMPALVAIGLVLVLEVGVALTGAKILTLGR